MRNVACGAFAFCHVCVLRAVQSASPETCSGGRWQGAGSEAAAAPQVERPQAAAAAVHGARRAAEGVRASPWGLLGLRPACVGPGGGGVVENRCAGEMVFSGRHQDTGFCAVHVVAENAAFDIWDVLCSGACALFVIKFCFAEIGNALVLMAPDMRLDDVHNAGGLRAPVVSRHAVVPLLLST